MPYVMSLYPFRHRVDAERLGWLIKQLAPPAGFEPATVGLEVQPEGVQQAQSGLIEPITSKELG